MLQIDLQISVQVPNAPFLQRGGWLLPASMILRTLHQQLAIVSEVFLRTTITINSRIKIIFKSYYQPQLTAHKVLIFQATWK